MAKNRTGHHRSQGPLLQPSTGLVSPLPDPDVFDTLGSSRFARSGAATAQALADAQPVGCGQGFAGVSAAIHIGFDQYRPDAVALKPILPHLLQDQPVTATGQIGAMQLGPNEKT